MKLVMSIIQHNSRSTSRWHCDQRVCKPFEVKLKPYSFSCAGPLLYDPEANFLRLMAKKHLKRCSAHRLLKVQGNQCLVAAVECLAALAPFSIGVARDVLGPSRPPLEVQEAGGTNVSNHRTPTNQTSTGMGGGRRKCGQTGTKLRVGCGGGRVGPEKGGKMWAEKGGQV